jgi:hypothetical protein
MMLFTLAGVVLLCVGSAGCLSSATGSADPDSPPYEHGDLLLAPDGSMAFVETYSEIDGYYLLPVLSMDFMDQSFETGGLGIWGSREETEAYFQKWVRG